MLEEDSAQLFFFVKKLLGETEVMGLKSLGALSKIFLSNLFLILSSRHKRLATKLTILLVKKFQTNLKQRGLFNK